MSENKQLLDRQDENVRPITTGQTYVRLAGTSTGERVARDENSPTITRQADTSPAGKGISPGLARALMGGLIGATLGTLAGALANKRTAQGVNHAAKGVGEGVNQAAKGVGHAVKSVAEGVSQAVIGNAADTVDAVKDTAEAVKPSVIGAADAVKDTAEGVKRSVVGAADAVKDTAEDVKRSDNQSFKLYEERAVAGSNQRPTGEVGIGEQYKTQTDVSVPLKKEQLVVEQMPVVTVTPENSGNADIHQGEVAQRGYEDTADI